jgi:hypothetical protein
MDGSDGGRKMSMARTRLLALAICRHVVSLFQKGKPAQTTDQIADSLALAPALVDSLSDLLVQGNILVRIEDPSNGDQALQPSRDIGSLTVNDVVDALDDVGQNNGPLPRLPEMEALSATLTAFRSVSEGSDANRLIKDL